MSASSKMSKLNQMFNRKITSTQQQQQQQYIQTKPQNTDIIDVFTDGACSNNGRPQAKAGIGIYFGPDDPRNVSAPCPGKQTNNVAELTAILCVATILAEEIAAGTHIRIYSDSIYAIRACTDYGHKCAVKHWRNIPNADLVKLAFETYSPLNTIEFIHVEAHTGGDDPLSLGNEMADRLACRAIGTETTSQNQPTPYQSVNKKVKKEKKRFYLRVPFMEKDEAKKLGARWDPKKKKWYALEGNRQMEFMRLRWGLKE